MPYSLDFCTVVSRAHIRVIWWRALRHTIQTQSSHPLFFCLAAHCLEPTLGFSALWHTRPIAVVDLLQHSSSEYWAVACLWNIPSHIWICASSQCSGSSHDVGRVKPCSDSVLFALQQVSTGTCRLWVICCRKSHTIQMRQRGFCCIWYIRDGTECDSVCLGATTPAGPLMNTIRNRWHLVASWGSAFTKQSRMCTW